VGSRALGREARRAGRGRRYCGEGSFDLTGIITALRTAGWTGPWGVEILSDEHRSLPVDEALSRAAATARRRLDAAPAAGA